MKDKHMLCVFCISAAEDYITRDDLFPDMPELFAKTLFGFCDGSADWIGKWFGSSEYDFIQYFS